MWSYRPLIQWWIVSLVVWKVSSLLGFAMFLRHIFIPMSLPHSMSRLEVVWNKPWNLLSDDILYFQQKILNNPGIINLQTIWSILTSNDNQFKFECNCHVVIENSPSRFETRSWTNKKHWYYRSREVTKEKLQQS